MIGHPIGRFDSGRAAYKARIELFHRADPALLHGRARFGTYDLEHSLDTFLAEGSQAPQIRPPDADGPRANPLSTMTGIRPFPAAMIPGNPSMVDRPLSSPRPP